MSEGLLQVPASVPSSEPCISPQWYCTGITIFPREAIILFRHCKNCLNPPAPPCPSYFWTPQNNLISRRLNFLKICLNFSHPPLTLENLHPQVEYSFSKDLGFGLPPRFAKCNFFYTIKMYGKQFLPQKVQNFLQY